jgi:hypothetical protein
MEDIFKEVFTGESKKLFLGSTHHDGPGAATSTSTSTAMASTVDLKPSLPASDATTIAQVTAGSVSVHLRLSHL